jgi:hypothetical protein
MNRGEGRVRPYEPNRNAGLVKMFTNERIMGKGTYDVVNCTQ